MTISDTYKVGDTIHAFYNRHGEQEVLTGVVKNITAHGRIAVEFSNGTKRAFTKYGREVGGHEYYAWHIYEQGVKASKMAVETLKAMALRKLVQNYNYALNSLASVRLQDVDRMLMQKRLDALTEAVDNFYKEQEAK